MRLSLANIRRSLFLVPPMLAVGLLPGCDARANGDRPSSAAEVVQDTTNRYLGQPRPGAEPVLFAAGIVSTAEGMYGTVVFSPGGDEAFWVKDEHPGLFFSRLVGGSWTAPAEFPFRRGYRLNSPVFSADGGMLYFLAASRGPDGMDQDDRIWVAQRQGDRWGGPGSWTRG